MANDRPEAGSGVSRVGAILMALLAILVLSAAVGANRWKHASSLKAMSDTTLKFYLDAAGSGDRRRVFPGAQGD